MATWVGTFDKRIGTPAGSKVGSINMKWVEGEETLFEISEQYDGTEGPQVFKARVNALRDADLERQAESAVITNQLNNLMNG